MSSRFYSEWRAIFADVGHGFIQMSSIFRAV